MITKKIILTGNFGVGKTSLFEQFLYSRFSEKYLTTIGVKVDKKVVNVDGREMAMIVWDIAGEVTQDKVPTSYFLGAGGVLYVYDVARPSTFQSLQADIEYLRKMCQSSVIKIIGNKKDLVTSDQLEVLNETLPLPTDYFTSAKTGENVELIFEQLARDILEHDA